MKNVNRKGFTLIELLIVIAIIGILAAVLIPNLLSARSRAFDTAAQACAKEVLTAAEIFNIDNPTAGYVGFVAPTDGACTGLVAGTAPAFAVTATTVVGSVVSQSGAVVDYSNTTGIGVTQ